MQNSSAPQTQEKPWLVLALLAAMTLMITMGARQSLGLFVAPIHAQTRLGIAEISLALAIGQFMWGAVQPVAGAVADRHGAGRVLAGGIGLLALGFAVTPFVASTFGLSLTLGILMAAGSGAASFSVLIGALASRVPVQKRGFVSGIVNAGGSFGQFVFAPIIQISIASFGWVGAMWSLAGMSLAALPLARILRSPTAPHHAPSHESQPDRGPWAAVVDAMKDRSYLLIHAGFFTCGFHIAFLVTHLPGEVSFCGLPPSVASWSLAIIGLANIIGSLVAGACVQRYRSKMILFAMYASRALLILVFLALPKTPENFYLFSAGLGATWLATVPPTAALVGKLFGSRYLATLFGMTLLSHQTGGFLGAWFGGLAFVHWGGYTPMWWADIVLAGLAAILNLPIREQMIKRSAAA